jgi:hypothetical protein
MQMVTNDMTSVGGFDAKTYCSGGHGQILVFRVPLCREGRAFSSIPHDGVHPLSSSQSQKTRRLPSEFHQVWSEMHCTIDSDVLDVRFPKLDVNRRHIEVFPTCVQPFVW